MRSYPRNSPQAAARLLALTMLADGHLSQEEFLALERTQIAARLGLLPSELMHVLQDCCEDLLTHPRLTWAEACRVDADTLAVLLQEVDDAVLRHHVLQACVALAEADNHLSEGEILLLAAVERWPLRAPQQARA